MPAGPPVPQLLHQDTRVTGKPNAPARLQGQPSTPPLHAHALTFCLTSAERHPRCFISPAQLSAFPGNKQGKQSKLQ